MTVTESAQNIQLQIRGNIGRGDFAAASELIPQYVKVGGSKAGELYLQAAVIAYRSEADATEDALQSGYSEAVDLFWDAFRLWHEEPEIGAMCLVELSRIGYRNNDEPLLHRVRLYGEQMWMQDSHLPEVQHWRGPYWMNFGNHLSRHERFDDAACHYEKAIERMAPWPDLWCLTVRCHTQLAWCLSRLDRIPEAEMAVQSAWALDKGKHAHDILLADGRIALAKKLYDKARANAEKAVKLASALPSPDWQTIAEAKHVLLLVAMGTGSGDLWQLTEEIRSLAGAHRLPYMYRWLRAAYEAHSTRGDGSICGAS